MSMPMCSCENETEGYCQTVSVKAGMKTTKVECVWSCHSNLLSDKSML